MTSRFSISPRFKSNMGRHRILVNAVSLIFLILSMGHLAIPRHRVTGLTLLLVAVVALFARRRGRRLEANVEAGFFDIEFLEGAIRFREGIVIPTQTIREVRVWAWFGRTPTFARIRSGPPVPWRFRQLTIDIRDYDHPAELTRMLESVRPPSKRAPEGAQT